MQRNKRRNKMDDILWMYIISVFFSFLAWVIFILNVPIYDRKDPNGDLHFSLSGGLFFVLMGFLFLLTLPSLIQNYYISKILFVFLNIIYMYLLLVFTNWSRIYYQNGERASKGYKKNKAKIKDYFLLKRTTWFWKKHYKYRKYRRYKKGKN
jgi:hypothetical protein